MPPGDLESAAQADVVLGATRDLLLSIGESTGAVVFIKDRQGRYLMVNDAACEILNLAREKILGSNDSAIFPPDAASRIMEVDRRVMGSGTSRTYEDVIPAAGRPRTLQLTKGPIREAHGHIVGLFGIGRDLSEEKLNQEALKQGQAQLQTILESAPDTVLQVDREGRIAFVNRFMTGMDAERVFGTRLEGWVPEDHGASCARRSQPLSRRVSAGRTARSGLDRREARGPSRHG